MCVANQTPQLTFHRGPSSRLRGSPRLLAAFAATAIERAVWTELSQRIHLSEKRTLRNWWFDCPPTFVRRLQ
jgi:hypothetical protein